MFRILRQCNTQPAEVLILLIAQYFIDLLVLFYLWAKKKENFVIQYCVMITVFHLCLQKQFKLLNKPTQTQLVRMVFGTLYGSFYSLIVMYIVDRYMEKFGFFESAAIALYLGQQTIQQMIYVTGFSVKKGIYSLHDDDPTPRKSYQLFNIYTGFISLACGVVYGFINGFHTYGNAILCCDLLVRPVGICVIFYVFIKRYSIKTRKIDAK